MFERAVAVLGLLLFSAACLADAPVFTAVRIDTSKEQLQLYLQDDAGQTFHRFERLDAWLQFKQQRRLRFAMNAGMYEPDYSPVGLFVADGKEIAPLNLRAGKGNFYLQPNGVFLLTVQGPQVIESSRYPEIAKQVVLATQSGPMLVTHGVINPVFREKSESKLIRNGVGVNGNLAIFVISDEPVNFHQLATYFRDTLHCQDALYLDGTVSSLYLPKKNRRDSKVDLGPIIGVLE